jgi:hypothetical protein
MGLRKAVKRVISRMVRWSMQDDERDAPQPAYPGNMTKSRGAAAGTSIEDGTNGMNFTVYNATGGKVVKIRTYDPRNDRTTSALYIVADKEDLGEELAQIITRESLTR